MKEVLNRLQDLLKQKKGIHILHTSEVSRADREYLLRTRWLKEIMQGWYMVIRPDILPGESTSLYANFWDFMRIYLQFHY